MMKLIMLLRPLFRRFEAAKDAAVFHLKPPRPSQPASKYDIARSSKSAALRFAITLDRISFVYRCA